MVVWCGMCRRVLPDAPPPWWVGSKLNCCRDTSWLDLLSTISVCKWVLSTKYFVFLKRNVPCTAILGTHHLGLQYFRSMPGRYDYSAVEKDLYGRILKFHSSDGDFVLCAIELIEGWWESAGFFRPEVADKALHCVVTKMGVAGVGQNSRDHCMIGLHQLPPYSIFLRRKWRRFECSHYPTFEVWSTACFVQVPAESADRESYVLPMPPPNVTGRQAFVSAVQQILGIRWGCCHVSPFPCSLCPIHIKLSL